MGLLPLLGLMKKSDRHFSQPQKILLVDDNRLGLAARRQVLEELGYEIVTTTSAEAALEIVSSQHFDLVVTDYKMYEMNGLQLIARLRVTAPNLPTILLSGFVEPLGLTEESTGASAVISKSAGEVGHLTRTVRSLLASRINRKPASSQRSSSAAAAVRKD